MKNAVLQFAALVVLMVASPGQAVPKPITFGGPTMGTHYRVSLANLPETFAEAKLQREIETLLADIDRQMSTYRPDSELSRFNRAPAGEWFAISTATVEVVTAAREFSDKSQGALDVTVGPLVRLWHFGPADASNAAKLRKPELPSADAIETAKKVVGYRQLAVRSDPPALRKEIDELEVDLSSIAPGYTVDRIADILIDLGIDDFTVEIGGEVRSSGTRPDGKPWRVAIERPLAGRREMLAAVPLINCAIATAGNYRKFFEIDGRRYSHIIDPTTGGPVDHELASVSVVAKTCVEADGWDTALLVLGPKRGYECAAKYGIAAMFISHGESSDIVRTTPAWQARFGQGEGSD